MANSTTGDGSYSPNLTAGTGGTGTVTIDTGPISVDYVSIGIYSGGQDSNGQITVTGVGADVDVSDTGLYAYSRIFVGYGFDSYTGDGRLYISNGATMTSTNNAGVASGMMVVGGYSNLVIGQGSEFGYGNVVVSGAGGGGERSSLILNGGSAGFLIGSEGSTNANLRIEAGAYFRSLTGVVGAGSTGGQTTDGDGQIVVTNAGSQFVASSLSGDFLLATDQAPIIYAGRNDGSGEIRVLDGAEFIVRNELGDGKSAPTLVFGEDPASYGRGTINGGSELRIAQYGAATGGSRVNGDNGLIVGEGGRAYVGVLAAGSEINVLGDNANLVVSLGSYDGQGAPIAPGALSTLSVYFDGAATVDSQTYDGATATVGAGRLSDGELLVGSGGIFTVRADSDIADDQVTGKITIGDLGSGYLRVGTLGAVYGRELVIGARSYLADPLDNSTALTIDGFYAGATDGGGVGMVNLAPDNARIIITGTDNSPYRGVVVGQATGAQGELDVVGVNSYLKSTGGLGVIVIGEAGAATADVTNGGAIYGNAILVSEFATASPNTVTISGAGSKIVADGAYGRLLDGGGQDTGRGPLIELGRNSGSQANVVITAGGELRAENEDGVDMGPQLILGGLYGATGTVMLQDAGSRISVVQNGARFQSASGDVFGGSEVIVGAEGQGSIALSTDARINILGDSASLVVGDGAYDGVGAPIFSAAASTVQINSGSGVLVDSQAYGYNPAAPGYSSGASVIIGRGVGGYGQINVAGAGSFLDVTAASDFTGDFVTGSLEVGRLGRGELNVSDNAIVNARSLGVGQASFYDDYMGGGRQYGGYLANVTQAGSGAATFTSGAQVTIATTDASPFRGVDIGNSSGTSGTLTISGGGTLLTVTGGEGQIDVARYGDGELDVNTGGDVRAFSLDVGRGQGSDGIVNVDGYGSTILLSNAYGDFSSDPQFAGEAGFLRLGRNDGSNAQLTISNGARIDVINDPSTNYELPFVQIGRNNGAYGRLVIDGEYDNASNVYASTLRIEQTGPVGDFVATGGIGPFGPGIHVGDGGQGVGVVSNGGALEVIGARAGLQVASGRRDDMGNPDTTADLSTLTIMAGSTVLVDSLTYGGPQTFTDPMGNDVTADTGSYVFVGNDIGANGQLNILGAGATLTVASANETAGDYQTGEVKIGNNGGTGDLVVDNGGALYARELQIGSGAGSTGTASLSNGATILITGTDVTRYQGVAIGDRGTGSLVVETGAMLTSTGGTGRLQVGREADGALTIQSAGQVNAFFAEVGRGAGADGDVSISGYNSRLTVSDAYGAFDPALYGPRGGFLRVGREDGGYGSLTVNDGASVNVINDSDAMPSLQGDGPVFEIGRDIGATGVVVVSGDDGMGNRSYLRVQNYGRSNDGYMPGEYFGPELRLGRDGANGMLTIEQDAFASVVGERAEVIIGQGVENGDFSAAPTNLLSITSGGDLIVDGRTNPDFNLPYNAGADVVLGRETGGNGRLLVTGAGSTVTIYSDNDSDYYVSTGELSLGAGLEVGDRGRGVVDVLAGAVITIDGADDPFPHFVLGYGRVGETINARGYGTVDGAGSMIQIIGTNAGTAASYAYGAGGSIDVGTRDGSYGQLTISNGGVVSNSAVNSKTQIAQNIGATGEILVTGIGSALNAGTLFTIGADIDLSTGQFFDNQSGDGALIVENQATVSAGSTYVGASGMLSVRDASLTTNITVRGDFFVGADGAIGDANITGSLTQSAGLLEFEIDGFASGEFDTLYTTAGATLDGSYVTVDVSGVSAFNIGDRATFFSTYGNGTLTVNPDDIVITGATAAAGTQFAVYQETYVGSLGQERLVFAVQQASLATVAGDLEIVAEPAGQVALTINDIVVSETGVDPALQTLTAVEVGGGQFESALNPGVAVTTFSQQDIADRLIRFVSNGSAGGSASLEFTDSVGFTDSVSINVVAPGVQDFNLGDLNGTNGVTLNGIIADDQAGLGVSDIGDINNDGIADIVVGASFADTAAGTDSGEAYVVFGVDGGLPATFELSSLDGTNGFEFEGLGPSQLTGVNGSVEGVGDVNNDGIDDFLIGIGGVDTGGVFNVGEAFLIYGNDTGFGASFDLGALDGTNGTRLVGIDFNSLTGQTVPGLGDVNGDGIDDIGISASFGDGAAGVDSGESFVVFGVDGGLGATVMLSSLDGTNGFRLEGDAPGDNAGVIGRIGDFNNDGIDDFLVGAPNNDNANGSNTGNVQIIFGSTAPQSAVRQLNSFTPAEGFRILGLAANDSLGSGVSDGGDINGDGIDDLIISTDSADVGGVVDVGATYVIFGTADDFGGSFDLSTLDGTNGFSVSGSVANQRAGYTSASAGDVNGDGVDDVIIGGVGAAPGGEVYVVFGSTAPFAPTVDLNTLDGVSGFTITPANPSTALGRDVSTAGDFNNDGITDILFGANAADPGGRTNAGEAYVVYGIEAAAAVSPPVVAGDLMLEVNQGQSGVITAADLSASDAESSAAELLYHATNIVGGFLEITDTPGAPIVTFTQQELDAGVVAFAKDPASETGGFDVDVTDGDGDVSALASVAVQTNVLANSFKLAELDGVNGFRLNGIAATDQSGLAVSNAGDINGDGFDDIIIGAPQANGGGLNDSGETYIVFGAAGGFPAEVELTSLNGTNGFRLTGTANGDLSGGTVSAAGDVNNDGIDDLLVGVRNADRPSFNEGEVVVLYGGTTPFPATRALNGFDGTDGTVINGADFNSLTGVSLSEAGDVNGDGIDDFIIGSPFGDTAAGADAGEAYVVFGANGGLGAALNLTTLNGANGFRIESAVAGTTVGVVAGVGDINDDGFADIAFGGDMADPAAGANAGQTFIVFGGPTPDPVFSVAGLNGANGFRVDGLVAGDQSARSLSSAGDINNDGIDDFMIGAFAADPNGAAGAGEVYVIFGQASGPAAGGVAFDLASLDGTNGFTIQGVDANDRTSYSISSAGDFDGDGIDDILISADTGDPNDISGAGEAYLIFGQPDGFTPVIDLTNLAPSQGFRLDGFSTGALTGRNLSAAGDVNGDGRDDLLIGAVGASPNGVTGAGQSYVVFGFGPNQPPIARDDAFDVIADLPISGDLFADNGDDIDEDVDGDPFSLISVNGDGALVGAPITLASGAALLVQSDGLFDYSGVGAFDFLAEGEVAADTFIYTIGNLGGQTSTATVNLTITGVNDAPIARNDAVSLGEDDILTGDIFADNGNGADLDIDNGSSFTVIAVDGSPTNVGAPVTVAGGGLLTVQGNGAFSFDTNGAYDGLFDGSTANETFTYTIQDELGATATAMVNLTINGLNDPPVAQDDDFVTDEDTAISGDLFIDNGLGEDDDVDDIVFFLTAVNGVGANVGAPITLPDFGGTLIANFDGTFNYAPSGGADVLAEGQIAVETFTYQISDDGGATDIGAVSITLNGLNDAPVAFDDTIQILEDEDFAGSVFADNGIAADLDIDAGDMFTLTAVNGDPLSVGQPVALPGGGVVTVSAAGGVVFANNNSYQALTDGETLVESFTYTITDQLGAMSTATANLVIQGENDAPQTQDDDFQTDEDTAITGDLFADNGFGLDDDVDSAGFAVSTINGDRAAVGATIILPQLGGQLTVLPDGTFAYTPGPAANALDDSEQATEVFTYEIIDADGGVGGPSTVSITVDGLNDAPVANNDQFAVLADETLIFNPIAGGGAAGQDADPEGSALTLVTLNGQAFSPGDVIALQSGANIAISAAGVLEYRPSGAFDGLAPSQTAEEIFAYEIEDEGGLRSGAQVRIVVAAPDAPPIAANDAFAATEDGVSQFNLFADNGAGPDLNFSDDGIRLTGINGDPVPNQSTVTLQSGAVITVSASGLIAYDPGTVFAALNDGDTVTDSFTYTITDGVGLQDEASVVVTVAGANDAPVAANDLFRTDERSIIVGNLFADNQTGPDFDVDSGFTVTAINGDDALVGGEIALPSGALLTVAPDGAVTFDPNNAFFPLNDGQQDAEQITYTITDDQGATDEATVVFAVTGVTDTIIGTTGNDVIRGTDNADDIDGLGGNDLITGLDGDDSIRGGEGRDIVRGGRDNDLLQGGADGDRMFGEGGDDRLEGGGGADRLLGLSGNDTVVGGAGNDVVSGGGGDDLVIGALGDDRLRGGRDNDTLIAGAGRDQLQGGTGRDLLLGEDGNDNLTGAGGADTLSGGDGIDRLFGRRGNDELTGGDGGDRFIFNLGDGFDTITDFDQGADRIRIGTGADVFGDLTITQEGDDALIAFGNVRILALDENANDFTDADFIL